MDKAIIKEIILSNICVKETLVKKVNTALLIFRRDFNQLKLRESFAPVMEEIIVILNHQVSQKEKLEAVLMEVEKEGTLQGEQLETLNVHRLQETSGNILQIENCGEQERALSLKIDELLTSI